MGGSETVDITKNYGPYATAANQTLGFSLDSGLPKITQWSDVKIYGTVRISTNSNFSSYKEYTVDTYFINPNAGTNQISLSYEKTGEVPSGITEFECTGAFYAWISNINCINFTINCPSGTVYAKFNFTITWSRDAIN